MTDNVEILAVPFHEYADDRDWLEARDQRHSAEIVRLTPRFLVCSICSSQHHRAAACPLRQRSKAD